MNASEYADDIERMLSDYVDPNSLTEADTMADLKEADFGNPEEVADAMLTRDDVDLDRDSAHTGGVTTREEVAQKVNDADEAGVEERAGNITDAVAREVGAPTEQELTRAEIGMVSETARASELVEGETRTSELSVVRDTGGDVVGVIGGGGSTGRDVAAELGADHYSNPQEFTESLSAEAAPDGRRALLRDRDGDAVGEVEL